MTLSLFSGTAYGLSFPPYNIALLAWVSLALAFTIHKGNRCANRLPCWGYGLLTGVVANLFIFSWLWRTFQAAGIGFVTTLCVWLTLAFILGGYFAVFFAVYHFLPSSWVKHFLAGALWVSLDHIKSVILTGFPWALLSHTQSENKFFLQWASITGAEGLTFLMVAFNSSLAEWVMSFSLNIQESRKNSRKEALVFMSLLVLIGGVHLYGWLRIKKRKMEVRASSLIKVAILQGNIDQYQKWDESYENMIRDRYQRLSQDATAHKPDLIVWPESALPGWFPNEKPYFEWVKSLAVESKTFHLIGAVTQQGGKEFNSAFLISPRGDVLRRYDKQHLVPFGEYIPFGGFLKRWIPYLGQLGEFDAGKRSALFFISQSSRPFTAAPNICYEAIFSPLVKESVREGAELIVNITNDGWYLDTGAPEQHYVTNIFRAVEMGRPLVRAANTGISAILDETGREIVRSPLIKAGVYCERITLPSLTEKTVYLRFGGWFHYFCWSLLIYSLYVARIKKPNRTFNQKNL